MVIDEEVEKQAAQLDRCYELSNDWYLKIGGMAGEMLRGEIPTSAELPP